MKNIHNKFNVNAVFFSIIFVVIVIKIYTFFSAYYVWDDAFMYVRYADNILRHGVVAFNSIHGPAYGLTSLGFLLVVIPFRVIFSNSPVLTMICASSICGFAFIYTIIAFFRYFSCYKNKKFLRDMTFLVLILTSFVFSMDKFAQHFVSGMDTTFALLYLSIYFFVKKYHDSKPSVLTMFCVGLCGGFAFSVRPDLMVFTAIVPLADIFFADKSFKRSFSVGILLITFIATAIQLFIYNYYFGSPLPLPFYCKGLKIYGDSFYFSYRHVAIMDLLSFAYSYSILFLVIFASFLINPKKWLALLPPMYKGLIVASFIFTVYYLFFVLQIMHYFSRFYYPTLPALCMLTAYSFNFIYNEVTFISHKNIIRISKIFCSIIILFFSVLMVVFFMNNSLRSNQLKFNLLEVYKETSSNYWFCLDKFSQFPDDLSIATTEVGYPLAMNPYKVIIDLSGLNETHIAHKGFFSEYFFRKYQPDLIYLPHPNYIDMISEIEKNNYFKKNYDYYPASIISAKMGIAIKKTSSYYLRMKSLIEVNRLK